MESLISHIVARDAHSTFAGSALWFEEKGGGGVEGLDELTSMPIHPIWLTESATKAGSEVVLGSWWNDELNQSTIALRLRISSGSSEFHMAAAQNRETAAPPKRSLSQ